MTVTITSLLTASRMHYVCHNLYLAIIQYHLLLLLVNLDHANCFTLLGCTFFNSPQDVLTWHITPFLLKKTYVNQLTVWAF